MQTIQISEELKWFLGGVLVLYVAVVYVLAVFAQRRIHSTEDLVVAGRRLPLSLAWMTLLATWFGAETMLAAADEVRQQGLRAALSKEGVDPRGDHPLAVDKSRPARPELQTARRSLFLKP